MRQLSDLAIKSALTQNWKDAISLNLEILSSDDDDVNALNRLAFAYLKSGNLNLAKSTYKKVLKIDKYNPIAQKNLKWIDNLTKKDIQHDSSPSPSPTIFIEEPGRTRTVTLVHPAPNRVLCNIMTAQKVTMQAKKHSIEIRDHRGTYLGALPDDISFRLLRLINGGNTYDAYVKNIQKNVITVFLIEMTRSPKYKSIPSFPPGNGVFVMPRS